MDADRSNIDSNDDVSIALDIITKLAEAIQAYNALPKDQRPSRVEVTIAEVTGKTEGNYKLILQYVNQWAVQRRLITQPTIVWVRDSSSGTVTFSIPRDCL